MSTFDASVIKSGGTLDVNQLVTTLNSLALQPQSSSAGGILSSASTSFVSANSKTFTVAADDFILWAATLSFSINDGSSSEGQWALYLDGVVYSTVYVLATPRSSINGYTDTSTIVVTAKDLSAGSHTFSIRFARNAGAGTIYVANSYQWFQLSKQRA